jgi:hypothetical protein
MAKYITNENGTLMFICKKCDKNKYSAYKTSFIVFHSPNYMNSMLSIHPIYIQLLSLVDIGLDIEEKHWGFSVKQITKKNILNSPLLSWDGILEKNIIKDEIMDMIRPMFLQNMNTNPLFKSYFTIFEQTNKTNSMCILSSKFVNNIFQNHNTHEGLQSMHIDEYFQSLSLLFNMQGISSKPPKIIIFVIGSFKKRNMKNSITILKQLKVCIEGLETNIPFMTLEITLFPFFFPQGEGAYDGKFLLHNYLKCHVNMLFSLFTLYKPYLLFMYDICQSIQLLQHTSKTCLENNVEKIKLENPTMPQLNAINHIVKFHLSSKLQGSPRWHKSHLQDLLIMVTKFGMPHSLKTFTSDEMSSLKWAKIDQLKKLIKNIDINMTWKDCRVECASLFHNRFQQFMQKYILSKNGVIDKVEEYFI